jgi:hypothetical protein
MVRKAATDATQTHLWHPELHYRVGAEQLVFVLAGFDPIYRRDRVVAEIKSALRKMSINSYALWELIGDHDLMIQAWLPHRTRANNLVEAVAASATVNVDMLTMAVDKLMYHWMWQRDIDLGKAAKDIQSSDYVNLNNAAQSVPAARVLRYTRCGYIHPTPGTDDLKFFLRITNSNKAIGMDVQGQLAALAKSVLSNGQVRSGVLMKVSGDGGAYLLTGRVRPENYPAITQVVGENFRTSGVLEVLRSRTVTHMSALSRPIDRREQLLPTPDDDPTQKPTAEDVRACMLLAESDDLEFKTSAFTDVEHLLGRRSTARPRDEQAKDIAKAVIGMLNADGGTVIVGIAEADKFPEEELGSRYGPVERHGERIAVGVNKEFPDRSGWDAYQRVLASKLRQLIDREVDNWVKFHGVVVGTKTVCVLRLKRSSSWFYLHEKDKARSGQSVYTFYGRQGGETRPLHGREADAFKEAHPRTTRGAK